MLTPAVAEHGTPGTAADGLTTAKCATVATPVGPFTAIVTADQQRPVVLASGWTAEVGELLPLISRRLRPNDVIPSSHLDEVTERITAYHDGDIHAIDDVAVAQRSGPFIERAWEVLRAIPAGQPVSYTEFADRSGRPTAVRAAGSACSRNAAALFVPCHRVVPAGGGVGSFRWGPEVKRWLLAHELAHEHAQHEHTG